MQTRLTRRQLLKQAALAAGGATAGGLTIDGLGAVGRAQGAPAAPQPQRGGQIIVGFSQEPQNFNPIMPWIEVQRGIHMDLYDALWRLDPRGKLVPNLAADIPTVAGGGISRVAWPSRSSCAGTPTGTMGNRSGPRTSCSPGRP